jgi:hypothetical protein
MEKMPSRRKLPAWVGGLLWVGACAVSSYVMMAYDFVPGRLGAQRTSWPADTNLLKTSEGVTVVAFLHPRCICSRATVKQLVKTLADHPEATLIASVFVPQETTDGQAWEEGEYVKALRAQLPQVEIVYDPGGVEAERFGALTSGTILVYDWQGREIFRGGITDRRGGERDNRGLRQLAQAIDRHKTLMQGTPSPVFGCPLVASAIRRGESL